MLAAAFAVPAVAAPGEWHLPAPVEAPAPVKPLGFEVPGESFPGSAFYYLADAPYVPSAAAAREAAPAQADYAAPPGIPGLLPTGPAARALTAAGTATDRLRAQRCLTMAIYYEAATESDAGQRAVAQVVLNRVAHPSYPDTVCGVVFQGSERSTGCQFTFTCDGSLARAPAQLWWDRASRVARAALAGAVYRPVGLATHYHTLAVHPYWADSLQSVGAIGAHRFYRWRGAAGMAGAFTEAYRGREPVPGPAPRTAATLVSDTAAVADPLALARAYERQFAATALPVPMPQAAAPVAPEPAARAPQSLLGVAQQSGEIKQEYSRSGRWIAHP
ncbi:cell wall hydrolase [Altererythrobacter sp. B11]|nr:cell wall hydrolase [Altererythrobacter sp. B11]